MRTIAGTVDRDPARRRACTSGDGSEPDQPGSPDTTPRGGNASGRGADDGSPGYVHLDPQRYYWGSAWELFRCCLLRTLYSYNGKPTEEGVPELRPDLAVGPAVSPPTA